MLPVAANTPVVGSYCSVLAIAFGLSPVTGAKPPAMNTDPLGNRIAACRSLATVRFPVAVNVPAAGS
jgi:hypothetical protein